MMAERPTVDRSDEYGWDRDNICFRVRIPRKFAQAMEADEFERLAKETTDTLKRIWGVE